MASQSLVDVRSLTKHFPIGKGRRVHAVNDVAFHIERGETLGLVGESGSGKTTVGRCLLNLIPPTSGVIRFNGTDVSTLTRRSGRQLRSRLQIVFQEPRASLNPRWRVRRSIEEPLVGEGQLDADQRHARVLEVLKMVGLPAGYDRRFPHQLTAGEQQRVGIARALATRPDLIVLDEPTSALDIPVRAEIIELLRRLQRELNMSYLFISHDMAAVRRISHRIAVMYLGSIVEVAGKDEIFAEQRHPYVRALLSSVLHPDPKQAVDPFHLRGEIPSPIDLPQGCALAGRCPLVVDRCRQSPPPLEPVGTDRTRLVACYRSDEVMSVDSTTNVDLVQQPAGPAGR